MGTIIAKIVATGLLFVILAFAYACCKISGECSDYERNHSI